jgi:large subunit ribosomal protein L35
MPKTKTKSGAKKRFSYTGSGKIKMKHSNKGHLLGHKSKKRKRKLRHYDTIHTANKKTVETLLGKK